MQNSEIAKYEKNETEPVVVSMREPWDQPKIIQQRDIEAEITRLTIT